MVSKTLAELWLDADLHRQERDREKENVKVQLAKQHRAVGRDMVMHDELDEEPVIFVGSRRGQVSKGLAHSSEAGPSTSTERETVISSSHQKQRLKPVVEIWKGGYKSWEENDATPSRSRFSKHTRDKDGSVHSLLVPSKRLATSSEEEEGTSTSSSGVPIVNGGIRGPTARGRFVQAGNGSAGANGMRDAEAIDVSDSDSRTQPQIVRKKKKRKEYEIVEPPSSEPRLSSVFHRRSDAPDLWSAPHRLTGDPSTLTCQWVILDEGWGNKQYCNATFVTPEALACHVIGDHCVPSTDSNDPEADQELVTCSWSTCKFKRYPVSRLRKHVLQHLAPLAWSCPFERCTTSTNTINTSSEMLDAHIQRYHVKGDVLRPLGVPTPWTEVPSLTKELPKLPGPMPRWKLFHPNPKVLLRLSYVSSHQRRNHPALEPPEAAREGDPSALNAFVRGLEHSEAPAVPLAAGRIGQNDDTYSRSLRVTRKHDSSPPIVVVEELPPAVPLDVPPAGHQGTDVEVLLSPPPTDVLYVDMTNEPMSPLPILEDSGDAV